MASITVLVPSFNHAKFIERTLRSIFAQTLPPEKLIVIDDGSDDESVDVIQRVMTECPFPSLFIARRNSGLSATLNEGLSHSTGKYFAYLGSDDVWLPQFLAEQVALLESRPAAVLAFSHAYLIDAANRIFDTTQNWTDFADGDMLPMLLGGQVFSSPGVVYRRAALEKHRWNEDSVLEDYELYLKLSVDGEFVRNENLLCGWRQHGGNVSGNFPLMLDEWIAAQNRVAPELGLERDELDRIQTQLRFDAVASLVRHGHRRKAWKEFRENLAGSRSPTHTVGNLLRIAAPGPIFDLNRRRKRAAAIRRFGKLEI